MPTLAEWIECKTRDGRSLPQLKCDAYRRLAAERGLSSAPAPPRGVGDYFAELGQSLRIEMPESCNCNALRSEMNALGVDGCRRMRDHLLVQLRDNAAHVPWTSYATATVAAVRTGIAWRLNPLDPVGSLLDEAIRRAESAAQ